MKKFYLYGKLGKRFGREWSLNVKTVPEGVQAIDANIPGFAQHLLYQELEGINYIVSTKPITESSNGLLSEEVISSQIESREVHIYPTVAGGAVFIPLGVKVLAKIGVKAATKAVIAGTTAKISAGLAIASAVVGATIMIGASMLIGAIVKSLIDIPEMGDATSTKSYVLRGPENTTRQGVPVPVGYGRLHVGSTVIQSTLRSFDLGRAINSHMLESFDQVQIFDLIGEGPIEGIVNQHGEKTYDLEQGVYINDVPMKNLPKPGDDQAEGSGTYNWVMNESGTPTRLTRGETFEMLPMSDTNSKLSTNYNEMLVGPNPYTNTSSRSTVESAKADEAVVISHYLADDHTTSCTFVVNLTCYKQTKDPDHPVGNDTINFGLKINNGLRYVKKGEKNWEVAWRRFVKNNSSEDSSSGTTVTVGVHGIATTNYKMEIRVKVPPKARGGGPRFIEFARLTPETKPVNATNNYTSSLSHVIEEKNFQLSYPHCAIVNLNFDSMNVQSIPRRTYDVKLLKVPVPANYNAETRRYTKHWNGLFQGQRDSTDTVASIADKRKKWTDNPAWIFYDLATNPRYGLAKYGVGVSEDLIDKWSIYKAAKYCDELVTTGYPAEKKWRKFSVSIHDAKGKPFPELKIEDGILEGDFEIEYGSGYLFKGRKIILKMADKVGGYKFIECAIRSSKKKNKSVKVFSPGFESLGLKEDSTLYTGECVCQFNHPIVEPRYTCHLYLTQFQQALGTFKSLSGIFGAMVSYVDGRVGVIQERDKESVMLFNNSNVISDGFSYTGIDRFNRKTAVKVTYRNKYNNYNTATAYEEDSPAIDRFGYNEASLTGVGITSPSQAKRLARFFLYVSQLETEIVNFTCGREGAFLRAGEIIELCDNNRQEKYSSGRLKGLSVEDRSLTLDRIISKPSSDQYGHEFTVTNHQPNETFDSVSEASAAGVNHTDQATLIENIKSVQISRFVGVVNSSNIVSNLLLKKAFSVDSESKRLTCYNHGLTIGDSILFDSRGSLPEPLLKGILYTVEKVYSRHSFSMKLVSDSGQQTKIEVLTLGTDQIGNEGGVHYFISKNLDSTKAALSNIALGGSWAMSSDELLEPKLGTSLLDRAGLNSVVGGGNPSSEDQADWFYSDVFKSNFFSPEISNGWLMFEGFGWIYISDEVKMLENDTVDTSKAGFYYSHPTLGWVFYWRALNLHQVATDRSGEDIKDKWFRVLDEGLVFLYGAHLDDFDKASGGTNVAYRNNEGYFLSYARKDYSHLTSTTSAYGLTYDSSLLPQNSPTDADWGRTSSPIESVTSDSRYKTAGGEFMPVVKIKAENHSIGKLGYLKVTIGSWVGNGAYLAKYLKTDLGDGVVTDSYLLIGAESSAITAAGDKVFIEMDKKIESTPLFTQKFRVKSLKEADKGLFEVSASEYNPLKFKAIENNINVEKPRAYIPPQADMSIPEGPENLNLIDLTFRPTE